VIGSDLLGPQNAVVKPNSEPDVIALKGCRGERVHSCSSQNGGVNPHRDREGGGGGGLAASGAGAIVTPECFRSSAVDEGEFKLTRAIKVDAIDSNAALVIQ
jgi:hypothetical protein